MESLKGTPTKSTDAYLSTISCFRAALSHLHVDQISLSVTTKKKPTPPTIVTDPETERCHSSICRCYAAPANGGRVVSRCGDWHGACPMVFVRTVTGYVLFTHSSMFLILLSLAVA